jgi:hypothetical protein
VEDERARKYTGHRRAEDYSPQGEMRQKGISPKSQFLSCMLNKLLCTYLSIENIVCLVHQVHSLYGIEDLINIWTLECNK